MFLRLILLVSFLAVLTACSGEEGLPKGNEPSDSDTETLPDGGGGSGEDSGNGNGEDANPPLVEEEQEINPVFAVAQLPYSYQLGKPNTLTGKLSYKILNAPSWMVIDENTGLLTGLPPKEAVSAAQELEVVASGDNGTIIFHGELVVYHGAAFRDNPGVDFYDTPFNNKAKQYRNDLNGDLAGEIQFLQSHAVAPLHKDNLVENSSDETQSVYRSDVVAKREALVLFFPIHDDGLVTLDVDVLINGEPVKTLSLNHPNTLPGADNPTELGVTYSKRAWWFKLPHEHVTQGLSLVFVANKGAASEVSGSLPYVDVSPVHRMVVTSVRVGMLTPPRRDSGHHATLQEPIRAATDYFQTLPVSELIFASYADLHLRRVMINDGTIYDQDSDDEAHNRSQVEGGAYGGDMRENVGKAQVSTGINMANMGITSWRMNQNYPQPFKQTTAHHACGLYINGVQCHGLSGGNGIATLYNSWGNEFSHELGHGFSAYEFTPDYYGDNKAAPVSDFFVSQGEGHWGTHNPTSGYGYMMQHHKLRASIGSGLNSEGKPWFKNNAMSSGSQDSHLSFYTYYTGFMALNIQRDLNQYVIPTTQSEFASGYKVWDSNTGQWQAAYPTCDSESCPAATEVGVPVTTLLGAYQPPKRSDKPNEYLAYTNWTKNTDTDKAVIYPALHGNYGNLFDLPAPDLNDGQDHCWLEVANGQKTQKIELSASRALNNLAANQFHVNLPASFKATSAELYCQQAGETAVLLTRTDLDGQAPVFDGAEKHIDGFPVYPPLARVGFNTLSDEDYHGVAQFQEREMQEIEDALAQNPPEKLSANMNTIIASYSDEALAQGLSSTAWEALSDYRQKQRSIENISSLIYYAKAQSMSAAETKGLLIDYLLEHQLITSADELVLEGSPIYGGGDVNAEPRRAYINTVLDKEQRVRAETDVENAENHQWFMDGQSKIHLLNQPETCLAGTNPLSLQACDNQADNQHWNYDMDSYPNFPQLKASNGACADINSGQLPNHIILYGCGGGKANQSWYGIVQNQAAWVALVDGGTLKMIVDVLK